MAENKVQIEVGVGISQLQSGLNNASSVVRDATNQMSSQFDQLANTINNLKAPFLAFTSILSGGALFKDAIAYTEEYTLGVQKLSKTLGVTTQEASGLRLAMDKLGVDTDMSNTAIFRLQMSLRQNESALNQNGVRTRSFNGEILNLQDIMMNSIEAINGMKDGYDRNALSVLTFGRSAKELQPILRLTNERIAEGRDEAKELGMELSSRQVASVRAYKEAMHEVGQIFEAIKFKVGSDLIPSLTKLAQAWRESGTVIIDPIVNSASKLIEILSSTTVQVVLLAIALKVTLGGAVKTAITYMSAFAELLMMNVSLSIARTGTAVQGLIATMDGLLASINPVVAGVVALAGIVYWFEAEARAVDKARISNNEYLISRMDLISRNKELIPQLQQYQSILDSTSASEQEKSQAKGKIAEALRQLIETYPQYLEYLKKDSQGNLDLADALERINKAEMENARLGVEKKALDIEIAKSQIALLEKNIAYAKDNATNQMIAIETRKKNLSVLQAEYDKMKAIYDITLEQNKESKNTYKKPEATSDLVSQAFIKDKQDREQAYRDNSLRAELEFYEKQKMIWANEPKEKTKIEEQIQQLKWKISDQTNQQLIKDNEIAQKRMTDDYQAQIKIQNNNIELASKISFDAKQKEIEKKLELERKYDEQVRKFAMDRAKLNEEIATKEIEALSVANQTKTEMGFQLKDKEIANEMKFQDQIYAIKLASLLMQQLQEPTLEGQKKLNEELLKLEKDHALKKRLLTLQTVKYQSMLYRQYFDAITSGFKSSIQGLINGTMTFADALNNILSNAINSLISLFVDKLLQAVLMYFMESALGGQVSANSQIVAGSKVAYVNALASFSANPLTVAEAPALASLYEAFGLSKLFSAKGGWGQVPNDTLAMIHKNEMVLPSNLAEKVRNMTDAGSSVQNITIHAMDSKSFESYLMKNNGAVFKAYAQSVRNGKGL